MNKNGFTLFETLIVIAIISIMTSLIITNFNIVNKLKVESEINNLKNDIEHYRNLAVLDGADYILKLDKNDSNISYNFYRNSPIDGNKIIKTYNFDSDLIYDTNCSWNNRRGLTFKKQSTPNMGGSITIYSIQGTYKLSIRPGVIKPNLTKVN